MFNTIEKLMVVFIAASWLALTSLPAFAVPIAVFQNGGDRLDATQNTDGGWGWPLTGTSAKNTIAPIAMGLSQAYRKTGSASQLTALQSAGVFFLSKAGKYSTADGYIAAELDAVIGGTTYADHIKSNYYDKLANHTYSLDGGSTFLNTAEEIQRVIDGRASSGRGNLAAWDIGMGLVSAVALGLNTSDWVSGTQATINALTGTEYYDVIGLAGAVYGLASAGADFDPTTGEHAAAGSLADLAGILASYQMVTGGFTWHKNYMIPANNDETIQETAYAILALNEFDANLYSSEIRDAGAWLISTQLSTGGWKNWAGGMENNEVTGEALWALSSVPEPSSFALLLLGLAGLGGARLRRIRS
ncbi:PEP-CTERM motif protein [bacterium BMS3Abin11]|nr:PEP-CTERM motif protein [bacterium BMS3Abin11]